MLCKLLVIYRTSDKVRLGEYFIKLKNNQMIVGLV